MRTTDTDGIFDLCHCGGHACLHIDDGKYRGECTDCPEEGQWCPSPDKAMVSWNKMIRSIKAKQPANR